MARPFTAKRRAAAVRRPDGTFRVWKGGAKLSDLPKQRNDYQGIATHIGEAFAQEHGRPAKVGDVHRTRTKDGTYHRQAVWYVRTPHGWRKAGTGARRPTPDEINAAINRSRTGR